MSKKKNPSYYRLRNGKYVALNGAARRLFKRKKLDYIDPKSPKSLMDIVGQLKKKQIIKDKEGG